MIATREPRQIRSPPLLGTLSFLKTVWEDCDIWRYQKYVENPPLAKIDAKPYMAMRKWAQRFYEVPPVGDPVASR